MTGGRNAGQAGSIGNMQTSTTPLPANSKRGKQVSHAIDSSVDTDGKGQYSVRLYCDDGTALATFGSSLTQQIKDFADRMRSE